MNFSIAEKKEFDRIAACVRALTLEATEKASSGHPGLPLGCAELGTLLYSELLQHDPKNPQWMNRDRFVLSGGHGSMLLYSLLHFCGYAISLDDIKQFRVLHSKCPGHPEYGITPGIETTTGPLGQGLATAVGMAIAQKKEQAQWPVFDNHIVALAGDGDMMEGVVHEAISLAGMQQLDNLIVIYDSNRYTIDGKTDITFTEDVSSTFRACGWNTLSCDGYDYDEIATVFQSAKETEGKPTLIIAHTIIGKGAPHFENQAKAHAGAMGQSEIDYIREQGNLPKEAFSVPSDIYAFFEQKRRGWETASKTWEREQAASIKEIESQGLHYSKDLVSLLIDKVGVGAKVESRTTLSELFQILHLENPSFIGGTADLNSPCLKAMDRFDVINAQNRKGNFINFGVREHAMAAISNGLKLYQLKNTVYCSTFLSFVDYLRPALRLSALMELPVIYNLAYDSVYIGEDGPTHQPVEQLPSIRCMPNLAVVRPADAQEGVICAKMAIDHTKGPIACITTRQKLTCFEKYDPDWQQTMAKKGAYIVKKETETLLYTLVATGSEVNTVLEAIKNLDTRESIRVVSMPCREYFYEMDEETRNTIVPVTGDVIVVEAAAEQGWSKLSRRKVHFIGIDSFGTSAPGDIAAKAMGIDPESVAKRIQDINLTQN
jgi:transketolase